MSELFNPYAVSVLGSPLPQKAPPQLRAEGRPMTRPQLDMARFVFGHFLEQARLSYVPNPTQYGFLPDGSRFRIVDVAGSMTMQVWPVGGEESTPPECPSGLFVQRSPLGINNKKFETWLFTFAGKQIKEGSLIQAFAGPVHKDRGTPYEWGVDGDFDDWDRYHQFFARKNVANFCYAHGVLPTGEIAPLEKRVLRGGLVQGCDKHKPDAGHTWVGYTSEGKARFVHVEIPYIHNPGATAGSSDNGIIEFPIKITSSASGGEVYCDQTIPMGEALRAGATMELLDITPDGRRALFMHVPESFYMALVGRPMRNLRAIWEVTIDFDSSSVTATQLRGPTGQGVYGADSTMYRDLENNHRTVRGQNEEEFVRIYTPDLEVDGFDTNPGTCASYTHYWDFKLTYSNDNYIRMPISEYRSLSSAASYREYQMGRNYDFTLGWGYGTFVVVEPQTSYYHSAIEITYGAYYREMEPGNFVVEYLIYEGGVGITAYSDGDITIDGEALHIRVERHVSRGTVNGACKTFSDKTVVTGGGSVTLNYECNSPATGDISATISNGVGIIETDGTYSSLQYKSHSYKREVIIKGVDGKDSVVRTTKTTGTSIDGPVSVSLTGGIIEGAYTINKQRINTPWDSATNTSYSSFLGVAQAELAFRKKNGRPRLSDNYETYFNSNIAASGHDYPFMHWWQELDGIIACLGRDCNIETFLTTLDGGKLSCAQAFVGRFDHNGEWLQSRVEYSKTLSPDGLVGEKHILDYERDTIADIWDPDAHGKGWRAPHQLRDNATYNPITKQVLRHTLHPATWMGVYKKKPEIDGLTPMTRPVMTTEKELPLKDGYVLEVDEDTETYHVKKEKL